MNGAESKQKRQEVQSRASPSYPLIFTLSAFHFALRPPALSSFAIHPHRNRCLFCQFRSQLVFQSPPSYQPSTPRNPPPFFPETPRPIVVALMLIRFGKESGCRAIPVSSPWCCGKPTCSLGFELLHKRSHRGFSGGIASGSRWLGSQFRQ